MINQGTVEWIWEKTSARLMNAGMKKNGSGHVYGIFCQICDLRYKNLVIMVGCWPVQFLKAGLIFKSKIKHCISYSHIIKEHRSI